MTQKAHISKGEFRPGFRLSGLDVGVLIVGTLAAVGIGMIHVWIGLAIGFVVGHFFLFCNVVRMSRRPELIWAAMFLSLALMTFCMDMISWPAVFATSGAITLVVVGIAVRQPSYHGVFWRWFNPKLLEWWERQGNMGDAGVAASEQAGGE